LGKKRKKKIDLKDARSKQASLNLKFFETPIEPGNSGKKNLW
jgi:hypothetical protein